MIAKFILLAVFAHSYGPRANYANLGEFNSMESCQSAAAAILKANAQLDLSGNIPPKLICTSK